MLVPRNPQENEKWTEINAWSTTVARCTRVKRYISYGRLFAYRAGINFFFFFCRESTSEYDKFQEFMEC